MSAEFYSKYAVKRQLGEGTFSDVLLCKNLSTGQLVAVKKLKKNFQHASETVRLAELVVLKKLAPHPNVLSLIEHIYDVREHKLFMVFNRMDKTLYDFIKSNRRNVPEIKVKQIIYQILKGVDHLHTNGVFHRDIKPENILVNERSRGPEVRLGDLGSVRGVHSARPYTEYISTRWYRAPECMLTAGHYDCKMDVWACGCVYFETLMSKPLFPGVNEIDQLTKIHRVVGTPTRRVLSKMKTLRMDIRFTSYPTINIAEILPFTSDAGRELLKRMLTYDPDVRPQVRRLLEHRYFNDLREEEKVTRQITNFQNSSSNLSRLSHAITTKPKVRPKIKKLKKERADVKVTKTWGPSTNTDKVVITKSKSKLVNVQPAPVNKKSAIRLPPVNTYPGSGLPIGLPILKVEIPFTKYQATSRIPVPILKDRVQKYDVSLQTLVSVDNEKCCVVNPHIDMKKPNYAECNKSFLPLIHK